MATDDFSAPLGQGERCKRRGGHLSLLGSVTASASPIVLALSAWALLSGRSMGAAPISVSSGSGAVFDSRRLTAVPADSVRLALRLEQRPAADPPAPAFAVSIPTPRNRTITVIDGTSGKRQDIVVPVTADAGDQDQQQDEAAVRKPLSKAAPDVRVAAKSPPSLRPRRE